MFGAEGIKTVMCTPTSGIPRWIDLKYDDIHTIGFNGETRNYGSRDTFCFNHPGFREDIWRIVNEQVKRFKDNDNVILYQIDNELACHSMECYCDNCKAAFIKYCKANFESVEEFNEEIGLVVWANEIASWDDLFLPNSFKPANPGLLLEFKKFTSASVNDFTKFQYDIIKSIDPDMPITTNFLGNMKGFDHFEMLDTP